MQLFYDPSLQEGDFSLRESEARHAVQVLRKSVGDTLNLIDGKGGRFTGEVLATAKKRCELRVQKISQEVHRAPYQLTLCVAPPKSIDRLEWLLEKATEIGVDYIQPIITANSERRQLRADRLERVLESAIKQCLLAWKPVVLPLQKFDEVISVPFEGKQLIGWINDNVKNQVHENYASFQNVRFFIGPEGGFTNEEAEKAIALGCTPVSLGPNRLRTETAGIVAVQTIADINWRAMPDIQPAPSSFGPS